MIKSKLIENCLISNNRVDKIIDLGIHPYADTFIGENQLELSEPAFPLQCAISLESGQIQLRYISNDSERYNLYAYSYTSSNSSYSRNHWDSCFDMIKNNFRLEECNVLEIGSNDGYLISKFNRISKNVLGIDSSEEMCAVARSTGTKIKCGIFSSKISSELVKENLWDIVIANNVFNHSNDPLDFALGVNKLLSSDGVFIFEVPYWGSTINSGKFDQIYHEHISYFTKKSCMNLLKKANQKIITCDEIEYHGGSIRVFSKKCDDNNYINNDLKIAIRSEENKGLFKIETYKKFQNEITTKRNKFLCKVLAIKVENPAAIIVGVGAAAKANTFLNFYNLDNTILSYITDASSFKIGKYTPRTRIPIVNDSIFGNYSKSDEVYALILSWNISTHLTEKILKINPNIKFLSP
jgi:2-polyprenyl-3-methyl-5-hydroxy-6-metoxy-1,4-benzoquinol methylase